MKLLKRILDAASIAEAGGTDQQTVEIDLLNYNTRAREYLLSAKTVTHATVAPGAGKTFKVNVYLADERVALASVPAQLADRKVASAAKTLTNAAATTQFWEFTANIGLFRPKGRFLYVTVDSDALAAGSSFALTVNLVGIPSLNLRQV